MSEPKDIKHEIQVNYINIPLYVYSLTVMTVDSMYITYNRTQDKCLHVGDPKSLR